jgi:hypothetical protein
MVGCSERPLHWRFYVMCSVKERVQSVPQSECHIHHYKDQLVKASSNNARR